MKMNCVTFASFKSKGILRSVLGAKRMHAYADGFDCSSMIRHDRQGIFRKEIPMTILTHSESLLEIIVRMTVTMEILLITVLKAVQEAYIRGDMNDLGWIRTTENLADGINKLGRFTVLKSFVHNGTFAPIVD